MSYHISYRIIYQIVSYHIQKETLVPIADNR